MKEKLQHLLDRLGGERDDLRVRLHLLGMDTREEWDKTESKWDNLQLRLRDVGLKLHIQTKEEVHDLGEEVDHLQHRLGDKVQDIRLEVLEEMHELGEELSAAYQKIRRYFS
jgi:polyhydroxyalkanoate synthesis regulator phasin